jgi:hypothetical protein
MIARQFTALKALKVTAWNSACYDTVIVKTIPLQIDEFVELSPVADVTL